MTERIGAIVLAGGRSSRFGRDKLAEHIDGKPLLHHPIAAVRALTDEIVVVAAPDANPPIPEGLALVHDLRPFEGPLAALAAGLAASPVDRVIVVAGDMPTLVPAVLGRLLVTLGEGATAAILAVDGPRANLPVALATDPAQAAVHRLLAAGERRLGALLDVLEVRVVPLDEWRSDDPTGATLNDIDTPADLAVVSPRARLMQQLADDIVAFEPSRRVIVAVDGVDGAGKTSFADELAMIVGTRREVLRASVDDFHRPAAERYARGRHSPEGFFLDSHDYDTLVRVLLDPFVSGRDVVTCVFDVVADAPRPGPVTMPSSHAVLILDGIFLHRAELVDRWDRSVFLDVDFDVSIPRGAARGYGDPDPSAPANRRYVEGQRMYLAGSGPRSRATYVVDNNDLDHPRIIK